MPLLQVLGPVDLRDDAGQPIARLLAQPKRLALLVYLVLGGEPGAYHRRERLLALLWPRAEPARARAALRQAVRFLRRELGAGAILSRGEEALAVDPAAVRCDALAWRAALARGEAIDPTVAEQVELLPGFTVEGAAAFEQWLDGERARLQAALTGGVARLAAVARVAGAPATGTVRVAPLANRTGDPTLDPLGAIVADRVAGALAEVPGLEVLAPLALAGRAADTGPAESADGADAVVSGTLYLLGDRLRVQLTLTDAERGILLAAPDAVDVPRDEPFPALDRVGPHARLTFAPLLDARARHLRRSARPPSYEAYRWYVDGLEHAKRGTWDGAVACFAHANELEPDFVLPRAVSALAHWFRGALDESAAAVEGCRALRERAGPFERLVLEIVAAWLRGDWAGSYDAARRQAALSPNTLAHYQVAEEARRLNRPRETRTRLRALDPTRDELRGLVLYWYELASAHHMLGEHAAELEVARQGRLAHPGDPLPIRLELRALAALGDVGAVTSAVDAACATPGLFPRDVGAAVLDAALELRAHGQTAAATGLAARCADWMAAVGAAGVHEGRVLARALALAGRLDEATARFTELAQVAPAGLGGLGGHHGHLQAHLDEGWLAVLAVQRGDTAAAARWTAWLEALQAPRLFGAPQFWLAAAAAQRGEPEQAVARLQRALAEGLPADLMLHTLPALEPLRGHAAFDTLLRPRG